MKITNISISPDFSQSLQTHEDIRRNVTGTII